MATTNIFHEEAFLKKLKAMLNDDMISAAEPVIQEALKAAEARMRQAVAATVVGLIDSSVSLERFGTDLRITIVHNTRKGD